MTTTPTTPTTPATFYGLPTDALEQLRTIAELRRPLLGTVSGGQVRALNNQEDAIRARIGCLSISDAIEHTLEVWVNDERCSCPTCRLDRIRKQWR